MAWELGELFFWWQSHFQKLPSRILTYVGCSPQLHHCNGLSVGPLQEMRLGNWSMLNSVQRKMGIFNLSQLPVVEWEMEFLSQLWKKPTRQSLFAEQCPTHVFMWASVVGIEAALGLLESPANPSLLGILLLNNCSLHLVLSGGVWPGLLRWSWAQANIPAKTGEISVCVF